MERWSSRERVFNAYNIVFNEELFYSHCIDHSLWNLSQCHHNGIDYWDNPYDCNNGLEIVVNDELTISLKAQGTKILCETRKLTGKELLDCLHVDMTSPLPRDLSEVTLAEVHTSTSMSEISDNAVGLEPMDPCLYGLGTKLKMKLSELDVEPVPFGYDMPEGQTFISQGCHTRVNAHALMEQFVIGLSHAQATLRTMMQQGT